MTRQTFCPPKPNELEMARLTFASRATFGTTSSVIAGSGNLVIDGRRQALILQRQESERRFDHAGSGQRMTDHRFVGRDRNAADALAEHGRNAKMLHLVVFRRRSAVGVDVVDVLRPDTGIGERIAHAGDDRLAVGARAGAVERVGLFPDAFKDAEDAGAAGARMIEIFEHQSRSPFRQHETVTVFGERL